MAAHIETDSGGSLGGTGIPECDQLVGLYSFPKSGNTWLRAIIAAIIHVPDGMMARYVVDIHAGQKIGEAIWRYDDRNWCFYKSHNKVPDVHQDGTVISPDKIIYIYRHPLDIFTSYLNFLSGNVTNLSQKVFGFAFDTVEELTPEQLDRLFTRFANLGTFDPREAAPFGNLFQSIENYTALRDSGQPVHILRYEDLIEDFDTAVMQICAFLAVPVGDGDLARIRAVSDALTAGDGKFFWKRKIGTHKEYLNQNQIDTFWDLHQDLMTKLGYLR